MDVYRASGRCWPGPRPTRCRSTRPPRSARPLPLPGPAAPVGRHRHLREARRGSGPTWPGGHRVPAPDGLRRARPPAPRGADPAPGPGRPGPHPGGSGGWLWTRGVGDVATGIRLALESDACGRGPQPGRGPHLVDGPVGLPRPGGRRLRGRASGSPTSSSTTSRPSAPSPSTSWSTPQGPRPARLDRDRPPRGRGPLGRLAPGQPAGGRGRRLQRRRPRPGRGLAGQPPPAPPGPAWTTRPATRDLERLGVVAGLAPHLPSRDSIRLTP